MTKTIRILTIAAFAASIASGAAIAQTATTSGMMKKDEHMASGAMTSAPKQ